MRIRENIGNLADSNISPINESHIGLLNGRRIEISPELSIPCASKVFQKDGSAGESLTRIMTAEAEEVQKPKIEEPMVPPFRSSNMGKTALKVLGILGFVGASYLLYRVYWVDATKDTKSLYDSLRYIFDQYFPKSLLNGPGKKIDDYGCIHEGMFKNDRLHGEGSIICPVSTINSHDVPCISTSCAMSECASMGTFDHGDLIQGHIFCPLGASWEGNFDYTRGVFVGKRVMPLIYKCNTIGPFREGQWRWQMPNVYTDDRENQAGQLCEDGFWVVRHPKADGCTSEGIFKNDMLSGQGKKTCPVGTGKEFFEGEFKEDRLVRT